MSSGKKRSVQASRAPARASASFRPRVLAACLLAGLASLAGVVAAQETQQAAVAARDFTEPLPIVAHISLKGGQKAQQLEIVVHRWRAIREAGPTSQQSFSVSIASQPPFIENVSFPDGPDVKFGPEEARKTVTLQFDVATAAPVSEGELVLLVRARDDRMVPSQRRLTIPLQYAGASVYPHPSVATCVLLVDAPDDFPVENAVDFCDPNATTPGEYDRVAVFFTPARDLREPLESRAPFQWRILNPVGTRVLVRGAGGFYVGEFAPGTEGSLPLAKQGSPEALAVVLELWERSDDPDPAVARAGPGTYTVQTIGARHDVGNGAFGGGEASVAPVGEWQDEGTFEVASARLHFQGFVAEQVRDVWIPDNPSIGSGKMSVGKPTIDGSTVILEANATWTDPEPETGDQAESAGARAVEHRASSKVSIDFPREIAPGHEKMATIGAHIEARERGDLFFTAGMHLLMPTTQLPPDRYLVEGNSLPVPWSVGGAEPVETCFLENFSDDWADRFETEHNGEASGEETLVDGGLVSWVWPRRPLSNPNCLMREASELDARTVLFAGWPEDVAGRPAQLLPTHLHAPDTLWAIPVFVNLTDAARPTERSVSMKAFGYAIYANEPGSYTGPLPAGGPEAGDGPDEPARVDVAAGDADPGRTAAGDPVDDPAIDPARQDGGDGDPAGGSVRTAGGTPADSGPPTAGAAGIPAGGDVSGGRTGDRGGVNPADSNVALLIRIWLGIAEPPENADGANFRYDAWGRYIGTAAPGAGQTVGQAPPPDGGSSPEAFAWSMASLLDSIDHCTLKEFVTLNLEGAPIAHCVGRYARTLRVAAPVLAGLSLGEAQQRLETAGLKIVPSLLGSAPTPEIANRIAAQRPDAGSSVRVGSTVEVDVYGSYTVPHITVPLLTGLTLEFVQFAAEDLGLELQPVLLGGAPSADEAFQVVRQSPIAGTQVDAGSTLIIDVYGNYTAPARATASQPMPAPAAPPSTSIGGIWQALQSNDQVVRFSSEGFGVYSDPGGLQRFGFSSGEVGFRDFRLSGRDRGHYEGLVKWRWAGGKYEWRPGSFTVDGDIMTSRGGSKWKRIGQEQPMAPPPPFDDGHKIAGSWRKSGGNHQTVHFSSDGIGVYSDPGGLKRFGFSPNEVGFRNYRLSGRGPGHYEGQTKWRWTSGKVEWRSGSFTVEGDKMTDAGGTKWKRIR